MQYATMPVHASTAVITVEDDEADSHPYEKRRLRHLNSLLRRQTNKPTVRQ